VGHIYRILKVFMTTFPPKQCLKVISHTSKFNIFTIFSKGEQKGTTTTVALTQDLSFQQKQIADATKYIVSSPTIVHTHYLIKIEYKIFL
jgi:hypothetical protein